MQLIGRIRREQRGTAMITALLCTVMMLVLGIALLAIVDTQAKQSGLERTLDRGFNLSESALTSQAFVLGRNWPDTAPAGNPACNAAAAGFGDALPPAGTPSTATARLRPNLSASYSDSAYNGATWQINVCDDDGTTTAWSNALLSRPNWDSNDNNKVWVRAQARVGGKTRVVAGLVRVREVPALKSKYGLVAGNVSEDVSSATAAITNASVVSGVAASLLNIAPPVLADPLYAVPASGVTGLRCGLLDNIAQVKTCITGAIGALSQVPLINTLVGQGRYEQYPTQDSVSPEGVGQLRHQSKTAPGVYMATAPGASTVAAAPSCGIAGATSSSVVFIEQVGTGDQYCVVDVSASRTYKALVIGSGRVIIRGNNSIVTYSETAANNLLTGVVYALNLQTADHSETTPIREVVRIEQGARVRGAVHADGKNATVGMIAPDFSTSALVNGLLCPGLLCSLAPTLNGLFGTLGVSGTVNALVNGLCLVPGLFNTCLVSLPALGVTAVVNGITAQLSTYGSAIHSDVGLINNLTVYGASGVIAGTFRDLQAR